MSPIVEAHSSSHYTIFCDTTPIDWSPNNIETPVSQAWICKDENIQILIHPNTDTDGYWLDIYLS